MVNIFEKFKNAIIWCISINSNVSKCPIHVLAYFVIYVKMHNKVCINQRCRNSQIKMDHRLCSTPFISNMLHVIDLNVGSRREVDSLENSIFLNSHSPIAENMPLASFGNLKYPSDIPPPLEYMQFSKLNCP